MSADAARIIGVVPATIRLWERNGKLAAQRTVSGVRLFLRSDVERVAYERRTRTGATTVSKAESEHF